MSQKDGPSCPGCGLPNYEGFCPHCRGDQDAYERAQGRSGEGRRTTGDRFWITLRTDHDAQVLPIEEHDGAMVVASGHSLIACGCECAGALVERLADGTRLLSHAEPSWPGADRGLTQ